MSRERERERERDVANQWGHVRQKGPPEFNSDWAHMSETVAKFGMCTLLPRRMEALDAWYRMLKMVAGFDI